MSGEGWPLSTKRGTIFKILLAEILLAQDLVMAGYFATSDTRFSLHIAALSSRMLRFLPAESLHSGQTNSSHSYTLNGDDTRSEFQERFEIRHTANDVWSYNQA